MIRKLGVDPGFGGVKVAEVMEGELVTVCLPSVVGVGTMDVGALGLAGVTRGGRQEKPFVVGFDQVEYLVGPNVAAFARPIERMDFDRFTDGPELRALLYAALFQMINGGRRRVALAIGLPVEVLQDGRGAAATVRGLSGWLLGQHRFTVDGEATSLEVMEIKAKIAQPVATWMDWGLDTSGQWCRGRGTAKAPVLVVDQGFNTLDLLVVEGGRISSRYTSGDTLGMRRASEMAAANIRRRYGVGFSLHEVDDLVRRVIGGKRVKIHVVGELTNVTAEIKQAINSLATDVVRFVEQQVGKGRKFRVLLTGGGAVALAGRLLAQYPHAEVMPDPVLANARGLAKFAQRSGVFSG